MKTGQHAGAAAAAAAAAGSSAAIRGGGRRRSSVGRRVRASLAAEAIPEEAVAPLPPAIVEEEQAEQEGDDGQQKEASNPAAAAAVADAAADAHAGDRGTAGKSVEAALTERTAVGSSKSMLQALTAVLLQQLQSAIALVYNLGFESEHDGGSKVATDTAAGSMLSSHH